MATVGAETDVAVDRTNMGEADRDLPLDGHEATIVAHDEREEGPKPPRKPLKLRAVDLGPWPEKLSLGREDLYGGDGG